MPGRRRPNGRSRGRCSNSLARAVVDPGGPTPPHPPYPDAAEIPAFAAAATASSGEPIPILVTPESGEFTVTAEGQTLTVDYQYGMPSPIGAGPYDRSVQTDPPPLVGNEATVAGGSGLDQALTDAAGSGTVTITDSQTYGAVDVGSSDVPIASILIRAGNQVRPVVRLPGAATPTDPPVAWVFTGGAADSELTLDGLLISGGDIVLRGGFASVRITACTADPGTLDSTLALAVSADERPLAPVRIWIEADPTAAPGASPAIASMEIDNCILGPVRTRNGGAVEAVSVSDSIVQGIAPAPADPGPLSSADVYDPELLAQSLAADDPVAVAVTAALTAAGQTAATTAITGYAGGAPSASALAAIVGGLGDILSGPSLYSPGAFLNVPLPPDVWAMLDSAETVEPGVLNLALLRAAFPVALSPAALAISGATLSLARVSVMGATFAHRLQAGDSILAGFTAVEDRQHGCVRFTACSEKSSVPATYQSPTIADGAALFVSTNFGEPAYAQLREAADAAIDPATVAGPGPPQSITAGAQNGSEMGAYSSQLGPLNEQRLLTKYGEYMPLGLTPVVIHVT